MKETTADQICKILIASIFIVVPLVFFPYLPECFLYPKAFYFHLIMFLVIAVLGFKLISTEKIELPHPGFLVAGALFYLTAGVSLLNTQYALLGTKALLYTVPVVLFFMFVQRIAVRDPDFFRLLVLVSLIVSMAVSVYAVCQYFGLDIRFWREYHGKLRVFSTLGNPNFLASYLIVIIPLALGLTLQGNNTWLKITAGTVLAVNCLALFLARSLGAMLGLGVALTVMAALFLLKTRKKIFCWMLILLFMVSAGLLVFMVSRDFYGSRNAVARTVMRKWNMRMYLYKIGWMMFGDRPVKGHGFGSSPHNYLNYQAKFFQNKDNAKYSSLPREFRTLHNEFITVLAETGVIGLGFWLWLAIVIGVKFWRTYFRKEKVQPAGSIHDRLYLFYLGSLTALAVHSFFSACFHRFSNLVPAALCLGGIFFDWPVKKYSIGRNRVLSLFLKITGGLVGIAMLILIYFHIRTFVGNFYLGCAQDLLQNGFHDRARPLLFKAYECDSRNGLTLLYLGEMALRENRSEAAAVFLENAKLYINDVAIYMGLGQAYYGLGDYEKALVALKKARDINFKFTRQTVQNNLGLVYRKMGLLTYARQCFNQALRYSKEGNPAIRYNLAETLLEEGKEFLAYQQYKRIVAEHPDYYRAYLKLAEGEIKRKNYKEAEKLYREYLKVYPDSAEAKMGLSRAMAYK